MEPVPFLEAIAWARQRQVVLPDTYYGELQGLARSMAFSIAGLAKLDQLQQVMDSLAEATANGESFGRWKKRAEVEALDLPAHRVENIFRTIIQGHYGRGRCEQQAAVAEDRPWLLYDAINDTRTRPSHAAMDGMVARHDDPIWQQWRPPAGFQCRCRTIALSEAEAEAERFIEADRKRLQDPERATARANAQPDKGWDYDPCAAPTEGLRRAIERKSARVDNRLMTAFETDADDAFAAWPIRGLARRFPAKDLATLEVLLREYAHRLPGDLPHGVKFVREGGPADDFYMATDGRGGFWFREVEYQGFNSRRDLFGGLAACAAQQAMTREQEYALESLWHEIWHNRQTGASEIARLAPQTPIRRFTEALNQSVARLTYPRFIERLGGQSTHHPWIIENGYAYRRLVLRLWAVVRRCGLEPLNVAGELATVNAQGNLLQAPSLVAALLSEKSGVRKQPIQAALNALSVLDDAVFDALLSDIKSL